MRLFRDWTKTRLPVGVVSPMAEITSVQVRLARAAADLDAAELLSAPRDRRRPGSDATIAGIARADHA